MVRRDRLVSLQQQIGEHWAKKMIGKEILVLVDGMDEDGCMVGRTQHDAPDIDNQVLLSDCDDAAVPRLAPGQMRKCLVTQNLTFDLVAHPVS
jgi:ribosomal protein S12 methylthiotransferase